MLFIATYAKAEETRLVVNLKEVRDVTGDVCVSLYREPETFHKEDRAVKVVSTPATKGEVQDVFLKACLLVVTRSWRITTKTQTAN